MLTRLLLSAALLLPLAGCDIPEARDLFSDKGVQATPAAAPVPATAQAAYQQAYDAYQARDTAKELTILIDANTRFPNDPYLMRPLAYAYIDNKRAAEAAPLFDRLISGNPGNAQYYADKGVALDFMRQHADAQASYKQAIALAPDNASFKNNMAMSMLLNGQTDEAIAILEPLSQQPAATRKTRQNLALAYGLKGDTQKALALDSQDLTPEQAKQNQQFYEQYAARKATPAPAEAASPPAVEPAGTFETSPMSPPAAAPAAAPAGGPKIIPLTPAN